MSLALTNRVDILKDRARMLGLSRAFFQERKVLEVDVPVLTQGAPVDLFIDLIEAEFKGKKCYLSSSPEYGMKRLLSEGMGDIYQISHVFRNGEVGAKHNPEFTMIEWYRLGFSLEELCEETLAFVRLFFPDDRFEVLSYTDAFLKYAGVHYQDVSDRDYVFAFEIEPKMQGFTAVYDFPASDAALAKVEGKFAKRFELYYNGMELANGYDELKDPIELTERFEKANRLRRDLNKPTYPLDTQFIEAMHDFPTCAGVAVGFDRLMMIRHKATHIKEVLPFAWE